ncbi:translocation/assembly module TamB domain-containing protein [Actibacterium lipolyticum]|uniref:Translocation and assembly module TamB n=1 Tax=Actibacterium lipolyticum TaxID=1524263 RepID=A0A238JLA2_9RHOB|nr:translocation/assembly module TamB domain-containing protein [Actibacterium lipolyticum]SMX30702.1 Translocation and assembly module TamB [Actibacterium lipolyticum]
MRFVFALLFLVLSAIPTFAQDDAAGDRGVLQAFLEDNLSGAGRTIRIVGFEGALSARATVEELTIADDDGVWLTLRGVVLDWSRAALLRGRLEVTELSADEIIIPRAPKSESVTAEDAEATPFQLPDLPVSVNIETIKAAKVDVGAALFGEAAVFALEGSVNLAGGEGHAKLDVVRTDGEAGTFALDASYANETDVLKLDLGLSEGPGGFISTLISLPGSPAIELSVKGDAPLSDFTADIVLSSDGEERLAGQISQTATENGEGAAPDRQFSGDLGGDIAPLFAPALQPFFGPKMRLKFTGERSADGRLDLEEFSLSAAALALEGSLVVAADGLPERFDLEGTIAGDGDVVLPLSGPETIVRSAQITARFDANEGEAWAASAVVEGFGRDGLTLSNATLSGTGTIRRSLPRQVTAAVQIVADGIAHQDTALATALGDALRGTAALNWTEGEPLNLTGFDLSGAGLSLTARGEVDGYGGGYPVNGNLRLVSDDIARFSGLAGRPISGTAEMALVGEGTLLGGAFDIALDATTTDLTVGVEQVDPLLAGESQLALLAQRDETGTELKKFTIANDALNADANGTLNGLAGALFVQASLNEIAPLAPGLSGPARMNTNVKWQKDQPLSLERLFVEGAGATAIGSGTVDLADERLPAVGDLKLTVVDLAPFSELARRPLGGSVRADVSGRGAIKGDAFDVTARATTTDLVTGIEQADALLGGATNVTLIAQRDGGVTVLEQFTASSNAFNATAQGTLTNDDGGVQISAQLVDLAPVAPGLAGPASLDTMLNWTKDSPLRIDDLILKGAGALVSGGGSLDLNDEDLPAAGSVEVSVENLAVFSRLAGRSLRGSLQASATGSAKIKGDDFDLQLDATGRNLAAGLGDLDQLIGGQSGLSLQASRADGRITVSALSLETGQITAQVSGGVGDSETLNFNARLANLGLLVPEFPGPVTASGTATAVGSDWQLALNATGPGGTTARVAGRVAGDGKTMNLSTDGTAPLGLANSFIAPRSVQGTVGYDLRINGKPGLDALSGTIATSGARFSAPTLGVAIRDLNADIGLAGGRASVQVRGDVVGGGRVVVTGPVSLTAPFDSDLEIRLNNVSLSDPELYQSSVRGDLRLSGPLASGGQIRGTLELGETEVQVPSTIGGVSGAIPDGLVHVNDKAAAKATRDRAGLSPTAGTESEAGASGGLGLNVTVKAPSQIFVRGRGLDAELGGQLRVTGTTSDVIPIGRFDLVRGRLDILGKRLDLTEGQIRLQGAFDPYIRLVAETQADDVTIQIVTEGPVSEPEVSFLSQPELPQDEVLARLLFGQGIDNLSPLQAAQLASAVATLAGRGGGGIVSKLRESFGLDDLDVTSDAEGTTAVRAGKYISDNIYTDVTVDSEGKSEINLNLDVSSSFTVKGGLGSDGDTSVGVFWERDY